MTVSSTTTQSILDKLNGVTSSSTTASKSNSTLGQDAFLKLLTTQLTTQDPTAPVDNSQMLAQLAQFSSVSGITQLNTTMTGIASDIAASRIGDAASWIGKSALVDNSTAAPYTDGSYSGEITLPQAASDVTVAFLDSNNQTVYSKSLGAQDAGALPFSWNGANDSGTTVASGNLKVVVTAQGTDGSTLTPTVATWAQITGVQSPASGDTKLVTALGQIAPADAERLSS